MSEKIFVRKAFDFHTPDEVETAIDNLEHAVKTDFLLDCYIEEFRAVVHWNTGGEGGLTEEQGEELIDYYYRRSMHPMIDFTNCLIDHSSNYGGSDQKRGVFYRGERYMLKMSDRITDDKRNDWNSSYSNSVYSEHICCEILDALGFEVQKTLQELEWIDPFDRD